MVFALGCLVSGLLALFFLPAFWRRAVRLSTRRLEMQIPLSMDEIVAERDQLRAQFATSQRQLEQKLEAVSDRRAIEMGELGRRATAIAGLDANLRNLGEEQARTLAHLQETGHRLVATEVELGAMHQSLRDVAGRADDGAANLAKLHEDHRALIELADERRTIIASLETRLTGLEVTLEDVRNVYAAAERELAEKMELTTILTRERDLMRTDVAAVTARRDQLQIASVDQGKRVAELERAHRIERRARARFENEVAAAGRLLEDANARSRTAEAGFARQLEDAAASQNDLRQQIENLRGEKAALEGALDVTRREITLLRGQGVATPASDPAANSINAEDAGRLRLSISEVGSEVARLVSALQKDTLSAPASGEAALPVAERLRALQSRAKRAVPNH